MKGRITGFDALFVDVDLEDGKENILIARSCFAGQPIMNAKIEVLERGTVFYSPPHNRYLDQTYYVGRIP